MFALIGLAVFMDEDRERSPEIVPRPVCALAANEEAGSEKTPLLVFSDKHDVAFV